jgi:hypothetical protein
MSDDEGPYDGTVSLTAMWIFSKINDLSHHGNSWSMTGGFVQ